MTALTLFLNQSASSTASTADQMLENASTGGTLSNKNTNLVSGTTGWITLYSQGNATGQTGAGSQPALADNGWIDDSSTLETNHLNAGTYSVALGFETTTTGTFTADFHFRFYQRSSGGTRTLIGEAIASSQTIVSTGYTVLTPSVSASASNTFATGDRLGCDVTINILTNTTTGNLRMQASSSSTLGNVNAEIVTPGYSSVTTSSRTATTSAVLQSTLSRIATSSAVLQSTLKRTATSSAVLMATLARVASSSAVLSGASRVAPTSAVLMATLARVASSSAVLTFTSSRIAPTSATLYTPAVFYASNVPAIISSLILSDQMSMVVGGTETSFTVTAPSSLTNSYIELVSQGGTPTATPVLPAPTGKGWSINLAGNTILAGPWSSTFTLAKSGTSMSGATLVVRWYRRTMDGTYYPIGVSTLSSQTFSTKASYTVPTVTVNFPWQFIQNDTLYVDAFVFNGSTAWASDVFTVYVSNSATMGVTNDGTTTAPQMISTPAGLTCLIGSSAFQTGSGIPIKNESFTLADAIDQRSVLTLTGEDANGNISFIDNMPVILSDSAQGKLYDGYLASDQMSKVSAHPSIPQREHKLTFADHHRDYDKEANGILGVNTNGTNYLNWSAGDIACDFIDKVETANGIWGEYAIESDYTPTTFSQGTLSGTVATSTTSPFVYAPNTLVPPITTNTGDLELTRAGSQFMLTESVTSDFSSGTLTNMVASNNELSPTTQSALKVVAPYLPVATSISNAAATESAGAQTSGEYTLNVMTMNIWSGSVTIGTNDTFNYDIWIAGSSPSFPIGISFDCSDATALTAQNGTLDSNGTVGLFDQNGVSVDPLQDLGSYAKDCWYTRNIPLTGLNGKTLQVVYLYFAGTSAGTYTAYFKNCYLGSQSGSPFLSTTATALQLNPPVLTNPAGYLGDAIITSIVQVYNPLTSYRVSPAHSISSVGLVQNSSITWTASLPTTGAAAIVYPPGTQATSSSSASGGTSPAMALMVSYDNATWLQCTNAQALPGLPPGANVSGLSLYLREQFAAGDDPSAIPALLNVQITINSAANTTVSDIVTTYGGSTAWNTGTQILTGPNSNGNLILGSSSNPLTRNWNDNLITNQTFLAGPNNASTQAATGGAYTMSPVANSGGSWCQSRFDFAGVFQNGTIECDLKVSASSTQCGIQYRQTGWGNANNNGAYYVFIEQSLGVSFGYGSNNFGNTSGTFTQVVAISETINTNTYYHLKIVVNGNRHTVYFNHKTSPDIDILDNTYTAAGSVGFRAYTPNSSSFTASIDNFSMITATSGTWTSPSTSLSSLGTCGYNQVSWTDLDSRGQVEATTTVLASIDGGSTWQVCTNGAEIPQLPRGTSTSGKSLVFQMILSSTTPPISTPVVMGLYARICGPYGTVSGARVSPALSLTPVGYVASSNAMYHANIPTSTSVTVATSQDGSTWSTVGNSGGGASLGYWTNQPSAAQDLFNSNTASNYTSTSKSGGSAASPYFDTSNSRLTLAGGSGALYLNSSINCADVDLLADMDQSDAGGLCWHFVDSSDYYELGVYDASSSSGFTNQLRLYKVSSGARTLLGSASSVTFTRGTQHRIRVKMKGSLISVYWDGSCVQSYLDISPLGSGQCGFRNDGGTSRYYQLRVQPLGQNLSGQALYTKVTLTTSDPSMMPQLFNLVCCVRGPSIATGNTVPQLHPVTLPFAAYLSAEMDLLVQLSGDYYWYVDKWRQLRFGPRSARPGAFPIQSAIDPAQASGYLLYQPVGAPAVSVTNSADPLRNLQVMTNVSGLVNPPPVALVADGSTMSWTLGYPVYSAPVILINGQAATVGLQGVDNNKQFYWQPASTSLTYDSTLPKLPAGTIINVTYTGQNTINTVMSNNTAIAQQAAIELNSGNIAEIESALTFSPNGGLTPNGMTSSQAQTFSQGLLSRFGNNNPSELIGTTLYQGLVPGTIVPVFLPELGLWNAQIPLVKLTTTAFMGNNGPVYLYSVDVTSGANQSQWARVWY